MSGRKPPPPACISAAADREIAVQLAVDHVRVVQQRGVARQPVGPLVHPLERLQLVRLDQGAGPGELVVGDGFAARRASSSSKTRSTSAGSTPGRTVAWPAAIDAPPIKPERKERHVLGDSLLAHEAPVEAAALAAGEDLRGHFQGVEARIAQRRRPEAEEVARQRHPIVDDLAQLRPDDRREAQLASGGIVRLAGISPK